jgi:peptidoglycan/xylan/chitin deacetylase (PgdA/CDA1 family)
MKNLSRAAALTLRAGARLASRAGGGALLILTYHRVLREPDPLLPDQPDAREFAQHLDLLQAVFSVLPLMDALERLRQHSLPSRAVCITFDDGYANNFEVAGPLLAQRHLPATVFVAPGYLDGGRMFNDTVIEAVRRAPAVLDARKLGLGMLELASVAARRDALPRVLNAFRYRPAAERQRAADQLAESVGCELPSNLMMTRDQVRRLPALGFAVGAHTTTHPILTQTDARQAEREIRDSRGQLEELTGGVVDAFAYPNGRPHRDYDATHVEMVRAAGYRAAVTTAWGRADASCDPLQLPRIIPWDRTATRFALRMLRACSQRAERVTVTPALAAG